MRGLLLLAAAAALSVTPARAADMPAKAYNAVTPPASCNWCGAYGGLTVGYGWSDLKASLGDESVKFSPDQVLPGGVVGYRWEFGKLVAGIEVSGTWAGKSDAIFEGEASAKIKYFGDATAQFGLGINNGVLAYVLAGPAWANAQANIMGVVSSQNHFGWVAGGGIDIKMLSDNVVLGVVFKHYEFGDASYFGVINASAKEDVVQARLMYRFTR